MKYRSKVNGREFEATETSIPSVAFFESSDEFERVEDKPKAPAKKAASTRTRKQAS